MVVVAEVVLVEGEGAVEGGWRQWSEGGRVEGQTVCIDRSGGRV